MPRRNRVEPSSTDSNATGDVTRATVTTTTRMEFVRRVQVVPMREALAQLNTDLNQSLGGDVIISPRLWTGMNRLVTPTTAVQRSPRTIWFVGCILMFAVILALAAIIVGLVLAYGGGSSSVGESSVEKYEVGDLHYGISNLDQTQFPSNTYLSSDNQAAVQQYLSNQLSSESGFRGLVLDSVLVEDQSTSSGRKRRQTSCSAKFIIQNIRIYFDYCLTCTGSRNIALRRALGNLTTFQNALNLSVNNGTSSQVSAQVCSTPNITRLIVPIRLSILEAQEINSTLTYTNVSSTTTTTTTTTTMKQTTYSNRVTSMRSFARTSYGFTSKAITSQRRITSPRVTTIRTTTMPTTTTTTLPIETTSLEDVATSTVLPTIETSTLELIPTSSILSTELTTIAEILPTSTSEVDHTTLITESLSTDATTLETDATSTITSTIAIDLTSEEGSTTFIGDTMSTPISSMASTSDYFTTDESDLTTSTTSTHRPTTMRVYTTQSATTKRGRGSTYNARRLTSVQPIPLIPILSSQTSRLPRNITFTTAAAPITFITSTKPSRTRKQTGYSTAAFPFTSQRYGVSIPLTFFSTFQPKTPITSAISTGRTRRQTGVTTARSNVSIPVTIFTTVTTPITTGRTRRQTAESTGKYGVSVPVTLISTVRTQTSMVSSKPTGRTRRQTGQTTGKFVVSTPITSVTTSQSQTSMAPSRATGRTRKQTGYSTVKAGVSVPVTLMSTNGRDFISTKTMITTARTTYRTDTTATQRRGRFRNTFSSVKQTTPIVTTMRTQTTIVTTQQPTTIKSIDTTAEVQTSTFVTEITVETSTPSLPISTLSSSSADTTEQISSATSTVLIPTTSETPENTNPPSMDNTVDQSYDYADLL